jgi:hypothetical protein
VSNLQDHSSVEVELSLFFIYLIILFL